MDAGVAVGAGVTATMEPWARAVGLGTGKTSVGSLRPAKTS